MESATQIQTQISEQEIKYDIEELKNMYIESLSIKEKKAYDIAKDHLKSSFSLEKSVGFLKWCKKNNY